MKEYRFNKQDYDRRTAWFREARFGLFLHWGLYAIPARGEWVRSNERMPEEEYMPFFREFSASRFDPKAWAREAKNAGMKYAVLTAKHHDGFCLFDSKYTDFKATNTPAGRDLVREFLDAFRAEGLRVGLYYSLLDWHHPDYPHCSDSCHPMRGNENYPDEGRDFARYREYLYRQVEELVTNYGKLDIMWFDFSYGKMSGEMWGAERLVNMVRSHQPDVIIDNRLEASGEGHGSLYYGDPKPWHGDFECPEQIIPPEGVTDVNGDPMVWECCLTMNGSWGYNAADHYFKPASMLIRKLVECVSKGGNMLLNVGPDGTGAFPDRSVEILREIGEWMKKNSASIYGCGSAPDLPKPDYGRITAAGAALAAGAGEGAAAGSANTIAQTEETVSEPAAGSAGREKKYYFHVFDNTVGPLPLIGISRGSIVRIRALSDGHEIPHGADLWGTQNYPDIAFCDLGPDPVLPDPVDYVIEVTVKA
ncbi:MAG: alpha-L-fucosidase [Lachnospiraceae bacterium]|nr:alpha-L-fucosidase [Lachnospiraceae bacterium]